MVDGKVMVRARARAKATVKIKLGLRLLVRDAVTSATHRRPSGVTTVAIALLDPGIYIYIYIVLIAYIILLS